MKKHILVISQYFYPEQFRINDICTEWVKRGYKVTVITGIPNYPEGKYYNEYNLLKKRKEYYNGVNIIRIPIIPRGNNSMMLILNYFSFVVSGFIWGIFTKIKADYVFVFEVSPMTQALPGIWYSKKRKIPCYLYVQDLWPENVEIITGIKNRVVIGLIGKMVDYIYKKSTRIFTTSRSFISSITQRGVNCDKLEFWPQYAEEFYMPINNLKIPEISNDNAFNIVFAGNIGTAQGLEILPKVASIINDMKLNKKIIFNLIGDGRYKEELIKLVNLNGLSHMFNFIPKQSSDVIPKFISVCDTAFLSLTDNKLFTMTIPAKLQSYMACQIPIIASASGEVAKIINEANCGVCSDAGDVEGIVNNIINLINKSKEELEELARNAREYSCKNFDKKNLMDAMDKYFI